MRPGRRRTLDRYRELLELHALPTIGGLQLKTLEPPQLSDLYAGLLREGRRDGKSLAGCTLEPWDTFTGRRIGC